MMPTSEHRREEYQSQHTQLFARQASQDSALVALALERRAPSDKDTLVVD